MAELTDTCLSAGACAWGITAASLRSPETRDALAPQDGLYTLALRENEAQSLRVVGSLRGILVAPENPGALLATMADPAVRIVSLTITEKGYCANVASGDLLPDDPGVQHDLANPEAPATALGFLVQALALRRAARVAPFAVLSCDNLPGNGHLLHRVLTQFAEARDPALGRFVAEHVACPSTMVDRIVPATTDADRTMVAERLGLTDAWPVMGEPYFQWVIEENFPEGRPDWAEAGAEFTSDVNPFETMKLRLLNGAHTSLSAMGRLSGAETVAEAMADPVIRAFITALWSEVGPTIGPGINVAGYTARLLARFDNTALNHKCAQIATDASVKVPQRLIAPLRELVQRGQPAPLLCFALAAWMRSCEGVDDAGNALLLADPQLLGWADRPGPGLSTVETVRAYIGHAPIFGPGLDPATAARIAASLADIRHLGAQEAARRHLAA